MWVWSCMSVVCVSGVAYVDHDYHTVPPVHLLKARRRLINPGLCEGSECTLTNVEFNMASIGLVFCIVCPIYIH